jgi:5-oxoprolinase (ATP-hydrolysing)
LHQSRPRIFDLNIKRPSPLYKEVVEVDERVTLVGYTSDPAFAGNAVKFGEGGEVVKGYTGVGSQNHQSASGNEWTKKEIEIVRGISGEAVQILQPLDEPAVTTHLKTLYSDGYRSIAVVLCHSYTYPAHELAIGRIAKEIGFEHISLSSQLVPMIKMVPRGISSTADAYLTPVLGAYLDGFYGGFEGGREGGLEGRVHGERWGVV